MRNLYFEIVLLFVKAFLFSGFEEGRRRMCANILGIFENLRVWTTCANLGGLSKDLKK